MQKQTKRKILWSVLGAVALVLIVLAVYIADLSAFPGSVKQTGYEKQVVTDGVKSTFHSGAVYRYPGLPAMLEVSGDNYEMGLQYGALLKPEILQALDSWKKILVWMTDDMGIPYPVMLAYAKMQIREMAARLPQEYRDEMRGVSDGSGVPYDTVAMCSLFYDFGEGMGCTGLLMKGSGGAILQGRNNDTASYGGEEFARMTVIVRHSPKGRNSFVHMDQPLYLGVETGYNDKGLSFGEETLFNRKPDAGGHSLPFLIRKIMEEASSLQDIYPYFDKYHIIGSYGCVWADLDAGKGAVVELTPTAWARNELSGPILWDFNKLYDPGLAAQQRPSRNITNGDIDREAVASAFPKKSEYTFDDVVAFMRSHIGPDGTDYAWCGTKHPVGNWKASAMMIWDPKADGFFMAYGPYFASRQAIYHYYNDFSRKPELAVPAMPIEPVVEQAARIDNKLISKADKLKLFIELAQQYKDDANAQFQVAYRAFRLKQAETFAQYAEKAYAMDASNPEYKMYAGLAAFHRGDIDKAVSLMDSVTARYPEQDLFRLAALEKATAKDPQKSAAFKARKQAVLDKYGAQAYYDSYLLPLVTALEPVK
jgi:predicted choloylglycine hydrolase